MNNSNKKYMKSYINKNGGSIITTKLLNILSKVLTLNPQLIIKIGIIFKNLKTEINTLKIDKISTEDIKKVINILKLIIEILNIIKENSKFDDNITIKINDFIIKTTELKVFFETNREYPLSDTLKTNIDNLKEKYFLLINEIVDIILSNNETLKKILPPIVNIFKEKISYIIELIKKGDIVTSLNQFKLILNLIDYLNSEGNKIINDIKKYNEEEKDKEILIINLLLEIKRFIEKLRRDIKSIIDSIIDTDNILLNKIKLLLETILLPILNIIYLSIIEKNLYSKNINIIDEEIKAHFIKLNIPKYDKNNIFLSLKEKFNYVLKEIFLISNLKKGGGDKDDLKINELLDEIQQLSKSNISLNDKDISLLKEKPLEKNKISKNLFLLYPFILKNITFDNDKIIYKKTNIIKINSKEYTIKNIKDFILLVSKKGDKEDTEEDTEKGSKEGSKEDAEKASKEVSKEDTKEGVEEKNIFYEFYTFFNKIKEEIKEDKYNKLKELYKIYKKYYLDKKINEFILKNKDTKDEKKIVEIINLLSSLKKDLTKFKDNKTFIFNIISKNTNINNDIIENYTLKDFFDYLEILYKDFVDLIENFALSFKEQITYFNKNRKYFEKEYKLTEENKYIEDFDIKELRKEKRIKDVYKESQTLINKYISDDDDEDNRYKKVKELDLDNKNELKIKLAKFIPLLDTNNGSWNEDILRDDDYKDELIKLQKDFINILQIIDPNKIEIKTDFFELNRIFQQLLSINSKITNKERITEEDLNLIKNFSEITKPIFNNENYKDNDDFKTEVKKVQNLYEELTQENGILSDKKIKEIETADGVFRKDTIYFDSNISLFRIALKYIIIISVLILIGILLISIVSILILIYDTIMYIISLFVNPNMTKAFSMDYLSKNIIKCSKNNYNDDRYYILTEQKQNLILFNIGAYTIYLLLFYIFFYILHVFYANVSRKFLKGNIYDIDNKGTYLIIIAILIIYSIIHFAIYKIFFKQFIYIPYREIDNKEIEIDNKIAEYILIKTQNNNNEITILVDDNFFDILFDFSRIDELNTIFLNGINSNNADGCLEQKIIIYNLYMYLREYVTFDNNMQNYFKEYCTTLGNNKPLYKGTNNHITFLSLLNNNEIKMIKKYHEELDFYNNISNENIEYYNILNKNIDKKIKEINSYIITYNKTIIPFFLSILYIFMIFIFNFIVVYIIIIYILKSDNSSQDFNYYFIYMTYQIKTNFYDKILNWFFKL